MRFLQRKAPKLSRARTCSPSLAPKMRVFLVPARKTCAVAESKPKKYQFSAPARKTYMAARGWSTNQRLLCPVRKMLTAVGIWSRFSQSSVPCEENMYSRMNGWNSLWIFCFSSSNSLSIFCPGVSRSLEFPGICPPGVWTKKWNTAIYDVLNYLLIFCQFLVGMVSGSSREFKQRILGIPGSLNKEFQEFPGAWTNNY